MGCYLTLPSVSSSILGPFQRVPEGVAPEDHLGGRVDPELFSLLGKGAAFFPQKDRGLTWMRAIVRQDHVTVRAPSSGRDVHL